MTPFSPEAIKGCFSSKDSWFGFVTFLGLLSLLILRQVVSKGFFQYCPYQYSFLYQLLFRTALLQRTIPAPSCKSVMSTSPKIPLPESNLLIYLFVQPSPFQLSRYLFLLSLLHWFSVRLLPGLLSVLPLRIFLLILLLYQPFFRTALVYRPIGVLFF